MTYTKQLEAMKKAVEELAETMNYYEKENDTAFRKEIWSAVNYIKETIDDLLPF